MSQYENPLWTELQGEARRHQKTFIFGWALFMTILSLLIILPRINEITFMIFVGISIAWIFIFFLGYFVSLASYSFLYDTPWKLKIRNDGFAILHQLYWKKKIRTLHYEWNLMESLKIMKLDNLEIQKKVRKDMNISRIIENSYYIQIEMVDGTVIKKVNLPETIIKPITDKVNKLKKPRLEMG